MVFANRDVDDIELPDEVLELLPETERLTKAFLTSVGEHLISLKTEAMNSRKTRGIESNWVKCEESYHGIDDWNRGEMRGNHWAQPSTMNQPLALEKPQRVSSRRSTAFVRLTARYVDSGAAKVSEILLSTDDRAFSFSPTPVPEFIDAMDDKSVMMNPATGQPMERFQFPGEHNPPAAIGQADGQPTYPLQTNQVAEEQVNRAYQMAKYAETQVHDWMVECHHASEMRKVIFDAARLGVGVNKGPFPVRRRGYAVSQKPGLNPNDPPMTVVTMKEMIKPADKWVNPWNIFPDPACGDSIRNGSYIFEREYASEKTVRELIGLPGYITRQLQVALATKARRNTDDQNPNHDTSIEQFELWHFYGSLKREELRALNPKAAKELPPSQELVNAQVTMVNDIVVRATLNPLSTSGDIPYNSIPWKPRAGSWVGVGVAEQVRVAQEITNGSTRALLNNAGISAGPQIVIAQNLITPVDGDWELTPNKLWYLKDDGTMDDVRKAFISFAIPNVGDQIMKIVEYGMRLAEESTSIPLVTQGFAGKSTPDTYGAAKLQDNNANQLLRSIAATFDDYITEPLVLSYYEWYLLDDNIPADRKGEFVVHAHGSAALVEKAIQDQSYIDLLPILQNPQYGFNPKKVGKMIAQSRRLPVEELMYTKEEQDKIDSTPPVPAPAVQVAQIKAELEKQKWQMEANIEAAANTSAERIAMLEADAELQITKIREQTAQLRIKLDTDRDNVYVDTQLKTAQSVYAAKIEELRLKKEIAYAEFAMQHQISMDQAKTKLADAAMKLKVQKEMQVLDAKVQLKKDAMKNAMRPPVQTAGKAGDAFSQI